ncbi:MAG: DUF3426 domain-containing protein [Polaromonas sp.]|nr:DUF3426 domain-containing protein [Polaromonas sp.]
MSESAVAPAVARPVGGEGGNKPGPVTVAATPATPGRAVAEQEKPPASARQDAAARQGPVSVSFQTTADSVYPDELEHAFDDEEPAHVRNDVSFVRQARRKAFWRRPAVMAVSGALGLLLLAALLLQVAFFQRDAIAAARPAAVPWLQQMCARLGCEVGPLKRIDAVVIDSSSFSRLGPDAFRLNFAIKNAGASALAMPALEVTLTDTQERAVVRRVLTPAQFGAAAATLPAGGEFAGSVAMKVPADTAAPDGTPLRVAGYRVLAFYP